MEEDLEELQKELRSLVVSSSTRVDAMSLLRDYRNMFGSSVPIRKFGYNDPVKFLREKCHNCFVFQGSSANPELMLICPDELRHLDNFVQKQRIGPALKHKGKRRSVPEHLMTPAHNTIASTFVKKTNAPLQAPAAIKANNHQYTPGSPLHPPLTNGSNTQVFKGKNKDILKSDTSNFHVQDFLKKRALMQSRGSAGGDAENECLDNQSGRLTSLSSSSSKKQALEELKREIGEIIADHPKGVWCTDLLALYKERYSRELNFLRFGYTSLVSVASEADGVERLHYPERGDYLLIDRAHAAASPPPAPRPRRLPQLYARPPSPVGPDDALPGIPYEAEVFPEDCMGPLDSIPAASLAGIAVRDSLAVTIGEVYSPSHFWMLRLGDDHYSALDRVMDEMNKYYESEEGRSRRLLPANVRVGYYCSSRYEGDWHRSLIVKIIDSSTVKVRHVDYGTVERCAVGALRLLLRRWGALPAQALRARMTAVRPSAAGRRWPVPACERFLELVRDRRLVAVVSALDLQDDILEVYLVITDTEEDVCIGDEMISTGHADPAVVGSAIGTSECYLFPQFAPLESGDTLSYAELFDYLSKGIVVDRVEEYRRYVPPSLPPPCDADESPPRSSSSSRAASSPSHSDDPVPLAAPRPSLDALAPLPPAPSAPLSVASPAAQHRQQLALEASLARTIEMLLMSLRRLDLATALNVATTAAGLAQLAEQTSFTINADAMEFRRAAAQTQPAGPPPSLTEN